MLQSTQFSTEAAPLQFAGNLFLADYLIDVDKLLKTKNTLTEVFSVFTTMHDHGGELGEEYAQEVHALLMGLQEVVDFIALNNFNAEQQ